MVIVGHEGTVLIKYGELLRQSMGRAINAWTLQLRSEVSHILLADAKKETWMNKTSLLMKQPFRGAWTGNLSFNMFIDEYDHPFQKPEQWNSIQPETTAVWMAQLILKRDILEQPTHWILIGGELTALDINNTIRGSPVASVTLAVCSVQFNL